MGICCQKCCQIVQSALGYPGLKDVSVMTSLTTVQHFSAFIDLSMWLCVCDRNKDTGICITVSPTFLYLFYHGRLLVFHSKSEISPFHSHEKHMSSP